MECCMQQLPAPSSLPQTCEKCQDISGSILSCNMPCR